MAFGDTDWSRVVSIHSFADRWPCGVPHALASWADDFTVIEVDMQRAYGIKIHDSNHNILPRYAWDVWRETAGAVTRYLVQSAKRLCDQMPDSHRVALMLLPYGLAIRYTVTELGALAVETDIRTAALTVGGEIKMSVMAWHALMPAGILRPGPCPGIPDRPGRPAEPCRFGVAETPGGPIAVPVSFWPATPRKSENQSGPRPDSWKRCPDCQILDDRWVAAQRQQRRRKRGDQDVSAMSR